MEVLMKSVFLVSSESKSHATSQAHDLAKLENSTMIITI